MQRTRGLFQEANSEGDGGGVDKGTLAGWLPVSAKQSGWLPPTKPQREQGVYLHQIELTAVIGV